MSNLGKGWEGMGRAALIDDGWIAVESIFEQLQQLQQLQVQPANGICHPGANLRATELIQPKVVEGIWTHNLSSFSHRTSFAVCIRLLSTALCSKSLLHGKRQNLIRSREPVSSSAVNLRATCWFGLGPLRSTKNDYNTGSRVALIAFWHILTVYLQVS